MGTRTGAGKGGRITSTRIGTGMRIQTRVEGRERLGDSGGVIIELDRKQRENGDSNAVPATVARPGDPARLSHHAEDQSQGLMRGEGARYSPEESRVNERKT